MTSADLSDLRRELADLRRRVERMEAGEKSDDSVLNMHEVIAYTTLSRREIGRRVKTGAFPKPILLGEKRKGWRKSAVQRWLRNRQKQEQSEQEQAS